MLHLDWLQTYNFGYAPFQEPAPVGDITLFLGENGSGKTTRMRALQLLLGVRYVSNLDTFLFPKSEFAFVRGVAGNRPDAAGRRPFADLLSTYEDSVTLACLLERKGGWEKTYFIVPGDTFVPEPGMKVDRMHVFRYEEYRRALSTLGFRDALFNLLQMGLKGVPDELINSAEQRFQFFFKLSGQKEIWDRYQQTKQDWREGRERMIALADEVQQRRGKLAEWEAIIAAARRRRTLRAALGRLQDLHKHATWRGYQRDLRRYESDQAAATADRERLLRDQAGIQAGRERFQEEYDEWQEKRSGWRSEREAARLAEAEANKRLTIAELHCSQQRAKVDALAALPSVSAEEAEGAYRQADDAYLAALDLVRTHGAEAEALAAAEAGLSANLAQLPGEVDAFLRALGRQGIPHLLVANAVEIKDPDWLRACEGALAGERFTVIVDDHAQRVAAKRIAQSSRYRFYVSGPNPAIGSGHHRDSLWNVVSVSDERAAGWVYERLAQIRRVETIEEGDELAGRGIVTITREAYLQERRGGRSVWRPDGDLVCGQNARLLRLRSVRAQLGALRAQLAEERSALQDAEGDRARARELLEQARAVEALPQERERLAELNSTYDGLALAAAGARAAYELLAAQEGVWDEASQSFARRASQLDAQEQELAARLAEATGRLSNANRAYNSSQAIVQRFRAEVPALPELDEEAKAAFDADDLAPEGYQQRIQDHEAELDKLPPQEHDIPEDLYEREKARLSHSDTELTAMRARIQGQEELFRRAQHDFEDHVTHLFNARMAKHFRDYCKYADGRGGVQLLHDADDHWALNVSVGYHGKPMEPLEVAPLSTGERIFTGLYMVLAALRAADAEPLLILDELFGTLDKANGLLVLQRLRETGAQSFVAAADANPAVLPALDAVWRFYPKAENAEFAPPIVVQARKRE
jgi:chromosome segregation ATPase